MSRWLVWVLLAGCGEGAATATDVCEAISTMSASCASGGVPVDPASCEPMFSDCTEPQLEGLRSFYECLAESCDGADCTQFMDGVDGACLD